MVVRKHASEPSTHLEVIPAAPEQEPILANLLELYAHDFSEFHDIDVGADGRFGYKDLPLYWRDPSRRPLLVRMNGNLAGFVLVRKQLKVSGNEATWDMAEFFVLRRYRRRGIGTDVALEVWRRFPGQWQVRVMQSNRDAQGFWEHAVSKFVGQAIEPVNVKKNNKLWHYYSFESPHPARNLRRRTRD